MAARDNIYTGSAGEDIVCRYLLANGCVILERNLRLATGELDIAAIRRGSIHIVEVKTVRCASVSRPTAGFQPGWNLHPHKIRKIIRTAEWYLAKIRWKGNCQIDGALVWLGEDGSTLIRYYEQILE